ncbi:glycosyltransferase [Chryseobacterium formosus]|uniref:Glycosyltransferase n=1 Tax=Chryseobacterium formosus TaxID=1537363 RepID=A0ABT3XN16_9FLAO|nr:glycosyltransferase [Chryseobacterium formosus]MCX8523534.1 glycosyltransferase [Chryseobacterium formosus]
MKVAVITNILTSYRKGFLDRLFLRDDVDVKFYCQDSLSGTNFISIHEKYDDKVEIVKGYQYKGGLIGFQCLPIYKIIKENDVIFLDGNPRILSNIVISFVALFSRKKFIMWTMAHSYGANQFTEFLRLKWTYLYKNIFVYTDKEVEDLKNKKFNSHYMMGMNNGLDQDKIEIEKAKWIEEKLLKWKKTKKIDNKIIGISLARLTSKNKFEQIIFALPEILKSIPNFLWVVIGDGNEEQKLKDLISKFNLENNVFFVGKLFSEDEIAPYMISAEIFLHPASIGLSLMHAFGYSLPVVVNDSIEMHGPEYGAFEDGKTGLNFKDGNYLQLANKITTLIQDPKLRIEMGEYNLFLAREKFNVNVMVDRFVKIAKTAK